MDAENRFHKIVQTNILQMGTAHAVHTGKHHAGEENADAGRDKKCFLFGGAEIHADPAAATSLLAVFHHQFAFVTLGLFPQEDHGEGANHRQNDCHQIVGIPVAEGMGADNGIHDLCCQRTAQAVGSQHDAQHRAVLAGEPAFDQDTGHGCGGKGQADAQQAAAHIENQNMGGVGISKYRTDQAAEAEGHQLTNTEFGHQCSEEKVHQCGNAKPEGIVDGKQAPVNIQCFSNGSQVQALIAAAKTKAGKHHQKADDHNDPFVLESLFFHDLLQTSEDIQCYHCYITICQ